MKEQIDMKDRSLVYYGPHKCANCELMIVKAGNGAPDYLEFEFVQDSQYPNHEWKHHDCKEAIAYSPEVNKVRPILAKYLNSWSNKMLVELADLLKPNQP